jgi:anti-sigma factor RsiW
MTREPDLPIGDYVLGELDGAERQRLERRLGEEPGLRERVQGLEAIGSMLESLPGEAWEALGERSGSAAQPARGRRAGSGRLRLGLAAGVCALMLGAGIGVGVLIERPGATSGPTVILRALAGNAALDRAQARMTAGGHRMVLNVEHLPATAPGEFYELWLMNDARSLVAVASFRVGAGGRAELEVPLPVAASGYRYLDISLQRATAGPAHSGDSVLRAAIRT